MGSKIRRIAMVKKWEYKVVEIASVTSEKEEEEMLNQCGEEGWELVAVTIDVYVSDSTQAFFKRERAQ